ncbi:MAG: hypothetical protein JO255_12915 [Alphaproteobacteria bacterium]|nr:hypothetical protein [Alphaproteobacteria bacterium]
MKYFEVQRFVGGQWEAYSIFDEQTLAIDAAKGLMNTGRPPSAVRVVEESEDGSTAPRTLFRETSVDKHNKEAVKRQLDNTREVEAARATRQLEKTLARQKATAVKKKPINWWMVYLRVAVVLTVGWFVFILIRHS